MSQDLQYYADLAVAEGPTRVIVDSQGTALPPVKAEKLGIVPHIILIRGDGWTLGAPEYLAKAAEALWSAEWIGYVKRPSRQAHPLNVSAHIPSAGTPCHPPHAA